MATVQKIYEEMQRMAPLELADRTAASSSSPTTRSSSTR